MICPFTFTHPNKYLSMDEIFILFKSRFGVSFNFDLALKLAIKINDELLITSFPEITYASFELDPALISLCAYYQNLEK